MGILSTILPAIKYYLKAQTLYNVHSPFIYDFTTNVLDDDRQYYAFDKLDRMRRKLLVNTTRIPTVDFGAGSRKGAAADRRVSDLANTLLTSRNMGALLFKIANHYSCKHILELGTALGMGSLYMALPAPLHSKVYTIEGNPFLAEFAKGQFQKLEVNNIVSIVGTFEDQLPGVLSKLNQLDLVYFDGHHQFEATINYFKACLPLAHEDSIFIFDDINWSPGMQQAWKEIKAHPRVTYSIDLFRAGIVFFKEHKTGKEHFTLIKHRWKPWSAGFWS